MKTFQHLLILGLCVILMSLLRIPPTTGDNATATAQTVDNIIVFYLSKPVNEFETLGQVKPGLTLKGSPDELLKNLISNAKKKFPSGEAILIGDNGMGSADVIKFK